MKSSQRRDRSSVRPWRVLSSHGLILFWISLRPGCTVAEISEGLSLTPRSVWGTVGDLRRAGMVNVRKEGRRHHYSVNYEAVVGQSIVPGGGKLRHVLRFLAERALRNLDEDERGGRRPQGDE